MYIYNVYIYISALFFLKLRLEIKLGEEVFIVRPESVNKNNKFLQSTSIKYFRKPILSMNHISDS